MLNLTPDFVVTLLLILWLSFGFLINMDWWPDSLVNYNWWLVVLSWCWDVDWLWLAWSLILLDWSWRRLRSWLISLFWRLRLVSWLLWLWSGLICWLLGLWWLVVLWLRFRPISWLWCII